MAKSKLSKRHIAGTLLLSSTAIGAVASGTASANKVTDFLGNGLRKTGELVKSGVNMVLGNKISNKLDGHEQIVGTVTVGLLLALTYGTYRAIKAGFNYVNKKNKNVIKRENHNNGIEKKELNANENKIIEVKQNNDNNKIENNIENDNVNEKILGNKIDSDIKINQNIGNNQNEDIKNDSKEKEKEQTSNIQEYNDTEE